MAVPTSLIGEGSSERGEVAAAAAAAARRRERACLSCRVRRKGCVCSSMRGGKELKKFKGLSLVDRKRKVGADSI